MFNHWAQPVSNKRWAAAAVALHRLARITRFKIRTGHHRAWQRATGLF